MATKTDMERIGVFSESGYTTIADPYMLLSNSKLPNFALLLFACHTYMYCMPRIIHVPCMVSTLHTEVFNESAAKGKQMVIGGTKSKTASQSGYFDATFSRILQVNIFKLCHIMGHD